MTGPVPTPDLLERYKKARRILRQIDEDERLLLLAAVVAPMSREWDRLDGDTVAVLRPHEGLGDDGAGGPDQVGDHHLPGP